MTKLILCYYLANNYFWGFDMFELEKSYYSVTFYRLKQNLISVDMVLYASFILLLFRFWILFKVNSLRLFFFIITCQKLKLKQLISIILTIFLKY